MVQSKAQTVREYLDGLPDDRRKIVTEVRRIIKKNLPRGYEETMRWGMISYEVPLKRYPDTYNKQPLSYAALASQKNYLAVYLSNIYQDSDASAWFKDAFARAGKKLDIGKSCVRFRKLDDLPLDVIGKAIAMQSVDEFIAAYEKARAR